VAARGTQAHSTSAGALGPRGTALLATLLVGPALMLLAARSFPALDPVFESPSFHVVVVSGIAGCALLVALVAALAAAKDRRSVPVLLALACVSVGFLMLAHGLATPGMLGRPMNMWVARLPTLALGGFAFFLGIAAWPDGPVARAVGRAPRATLVVPVVGFGLFAVAIAADPTILGGTSPFPAEGRVTSLVQGVSVVVLFAVGSLHWRRWRLGRDRVELSLVLAAWLAMSAIFSLTFGQLWRLSWWDYHLYLLAGFAASTWAVAAEFRRSRSLAGIVAGIVERDPLEQVASGHPEALDMLIGAVEARDRYTHGHSARVAELATRVGLRIGLTPEGLRALHRGASLHDVGKISVPDHVLNKPAELTSEEWVWIEQHPVLGAELAARARSLRDSLAPIRFHHERWDGSGYPDGLAEEQIPLAARVVAVADVWDALTSDRAYRPAWPFDRALSHVVGGREVLFDPMCVDALVEVLAESGLVPERARGDLDELVRAATACHPSRERRRRPDIPRVGLVEG
jgi:HD-GYP domain-containing protein (c-di-GMP phosphodiesterase class II)